MIDGNTATNDAQTKLRDFFTTNEAARGGAKPPSCREEIVLSTKRLDLRRFTVHDARLLWELDSDREVMRFITKGQPTPLARVEQEILPRILSYYDRSPPQGCWAASLRDTGEFIGWFCFRADKIEPEEMELGYRLKRHVWGRGLATEGAQAIVEKAFRQWGTRKICARSLAANAASQRVMVKAGLVYQAEFFYGQDELPGWGEEDRRGVKYGLDQQRFTRLTL